jgi:hypothetical protein
MQSKANFRHLWPLLVNVSELLRADLAFTGTGSFADVMGKKGLKTYKKLYAREVVHAFEVRKKCQLKSYIGKKGRKRNKREENEPQRTEDGKKREIF